MLKGITVRLQNHFWLTSKIRKEGQLLSPCEKIQLLCVLVCILNLVTRSCWILKSSFWISDYLVTSCDCIHSAVFWMSWKVVSLFYTFHFYLFIPAPVWVPSITPLSCTASSEIKYSGMKRQRFFSRKVSFERINGYLGRYPKYACYW